MCLRQNSVAVSIILLLVVVDVLKVPGGVLLSHLKEQVVLSFFSKFTKKKLEINGRYPEKWKDKLRCEEVSVFIFSLLMSSSGYGVSKYSRTGLWTTRLGLGETVTRVLGPLRKTRSQGHDDVTNIWGLRPRPLIY